MAAVACAATAGAMLPFFSLALYGFEFLDGETRGYILTGFFGAMMSLIAIVSIIIANYGPVEGKQVFIPWLRGICASFVMFNFAPNSVFNCPCSIAHSH